MRFSSSHWIKANFVVFNYVSGTLHLCEVNSFHSHNVCNYLQYDQ